MPDQPPTLLDTYDRLRAELEQATTRTARARAVYEAARADHDAAISVELTLRAEVDRVRTTIERALVALRKLEPDERKALEAMTQAIVNKILHPPLAVLKQLALQDASEAAQVAELVHRLFALEPGAASDATADEEER